MNSYEPSLERSIFCHKVQDLLEITTFNDITFNCKDGTVSGNRLVLSIYSSFLENIFSNNPLITSHPVHSSPDSGINLPEIPARDVENLLRVITAGSAADINVDHLKGLQNVATVLHVGLIMGSKEKNAVKVQAVPKFSESDVVGVNQITINGGVECDQRLIEEDTEFIPNNAALEWKKSENSDDPDENEENDDSLSNTDIGEDDGLDFQTPPGTVVNKVVCPICNITCKTPTGLRVHIGLSHRDSEGFAAQEDKGKRVCKCGKMFAINSRKLFKDHRQKCAAFRKQAFICEICKSPFDEMPSLTIHLTSIHGINKEPNSCICGETFKTKHRVRKHSITCKVYRDAAIFCEVCNLPFLTNNHLQQHYRTSSHKNVVSKQLI